MDSTPIHINTTNANTSHLDSTPVDTKTPDFKALTQPTELSKRKGKDHVPKDPESDPSLSDSSLRKSDTHDENKCRKFISKNESDSADYRKYRKFKRKKYDKKKNRRKRIKQDLSDSLSSDYDLSKKKWL